MTDDDRTPDERALAALFASLVENSPPSGVSPLEVVKLGSRDKAADRDRKIKRLKNGRNVLVAAVIVGVVLLVVPHLKGSSSSSTAASSSSSAASASEAPVAAAAPASGKAATPDFGSAPSGAAAGGGAAAASAPAAGSSAAGSVVAPASGAAAPSSGQASAASSAPAGAATPAGAAATPGPGRSGTSAAGSTSSGAASDGLPLDASSPGCRLLPGKAVAAVRAVFPTGSFGAVAPAPGCQGPYGAQLPISAVPGTLLTITVERTLPGACVNVKSPLISCLPVAGAANTFRQRTPGPTTKLWVYGQGYEILLDTADAELAGSVGELTAAGRAVIKSLG